MSSSIIILKPNKTAYNSSKIFWPIVLLNTLRKFIEKVICERLQYQLIYMDFIYPCQLGELKQHLTTDADVFLTHLICSGWIKNLQMSMLSFDISQFFPLLNYQLLLLIMDKACFDSWISFFFSNYLIGRKTQYLWNNYIFSALM